MIKALTFSLSWATNNSNEHERAFVCVHVSLFRKKIVHVCFFLINEHKTSHMFIKINENTG